MIATSLLVDERWTGRHGIGRYADEVVPRLRQAHQDLNIGGSPSSPRDAFRRLPSPVSTGLIYSPGYNAFLRAPRQVLTIHDLIHREVSGVHGVKYRLFYDQVIRRVVRRNGVVITVSDTSAQAIRSWAGDSVNIVNAGIGSSPAFTRHGAVANADAPYVLYVGNLRSHKNLQVVLGAIAAHPEVELRLVLPQNEHPRARLLFSQFGITNRTTILPNPTDEGLAEHYRGAVATVMPSQLEGFGLPALESVLCGTPVIYWRGCAAVAETVGDRGIATRSPADSNEWAEAIDTLMSTSTTIHDFDGSKYSWDRTAAIIDATLAEVLQSR